MKAISLRTDVLRARAGLGGILSSILVLASGSTALAQEDKTKTVNVDCALGETIAHALVQGDERKPLLVVVRGTCNESVLIDRNDVTLRGAAGFGGGIAGPDPNTNTVTVTASRVAIEGLTITGGRNGIAGNGAASLSVRNATVQSTGRDGVVFSSGASGTIDVSTIQSNPRNGVSVSAATATVKNSTISQNKGNGVFVLRGGAASIGTDETFSATGNTISQNGASGVSVNNGSTAVIAANQINRNGTDLATTSGRSGVRVLYASADIAGSNVISGNTGVGVFALSSSVQIGNPQVPFPIVNTITSNGDTFSPGGVFAFLGSSMSIRDAVISANNGFGLAFSVRSHGQLLGSTIQNNVRAGSNPGDGIRLIFGSALFVSSPRTVVSGNTAWGLQCTDGESSVINTSLLDMSGGNGIGGVSGSCTPF